MASGIDFIPCLDGGKRKSSWIWIGKSQPDERGGFRQGNEIR
jgi:hypothetical protein